MPPHHCQTYRRGRGWVGWRGSSLAGPIRMALLQNAQTHRRAFASRCPSPPHHHHPLLLSPSPSLPLTSLPGRSTIASTEPLHHCGARQRRWISNGAGNREQTWEAAKKKIHTHARASRAFAPLRRARVADVAEFDSLCSYSAAPSSATVSAAQHNQNHRQTHPGTHGNVAEPRPRPSLRCTRPRHKHAHAREEEACPSASKRA